MSYILIQSVIWFLPMQIGLCGIFQSLSADQSLGLTVGGFLLTYHCHLT
jgi:hypothetical protein